MPGLLADLAACHTGSRKDEVALLGSHLGRVRFVHLRRDDVVAQVVLWAKSLRTHFWHPGEAVDPGGQEPVYDEELVGRLVAMIEQLETD